MLTNNWHPIGPPASEAEAAALKAVCACLPDDPLCHAWTNVEFPDRNAALNEVDLILLARQGLFLVELKGLHGRIVGRINDWSHTDPEGRVHALENPVNGINRKAKRFRSLLLEVAEHDRIVRQLPYVEPVVVMHGLDSTVELSEPTKGHVFGLDGYRVKNLPAFSQILSGPARYDKLTCDAIVRVIQKSGIGPRRPQAESAVVALAATEAIVPRPSAPAGAPAPLAESAPPSLLFAAHSDEALRSLGICDQDVEVVRCATDLESLIGSLPDPVWDDLEAVACGEDIAVVIERRRSAEQRFVEVSETAERAGWVPAPDDAQADEPLPAAPMPAATEAPVMIGLGTQPRRRPVDGVTSKPTSRGARRPQTPPPSPPPQPAEPPLPVVPAEPLLNIARGEALAGRIGPARALHDAVREALETDFRVDWSLEQMSTLAVDLRRFPQLAQRLAVYIRDVREGEPRAPVIVPGIPKQVGDIWTGLQPGPAYSLLVRVPDVLDRASGIFLSQVIGPAAAEQVNQRLLLGRPDGGRIRVSDDGTVISRRDANSPWFVVGQVSAEEWFLAEAAPAA